MLKDLITASMVSCLEELEDITRIGDGYCDAIAENFYKRFKPEVFNYVKILSGKENFKSIITKEILGLLLGCTYFYEQIFTDYDPENPDLDEQGMPVIHVDEMMYVFNNAVKTYDFLVNSEHLMYNIMTASKNENKNKKEN